MRKYTDFSSKLVVRFSMVLLPIVATLFAMPLCIFKIYEPKMPEKLLKN